MIQPHAVLQVSNGVLDLGMAAVVGLQLQGFPVPVGDEGVIAVDGEEGQLGTGRGLHPPDDEPHRCGIGLSPQGGAGGLRHIGGAVHPVWDRPPVRLGYGLDQVPQAFVLADGDGEADIHPAADGDHGVGIRMRSGWLRGSIYWVLLFWGRFFVAKPLSQKRRSTSLPLQDANATPSFGGFRLTHRHRGLPMTSP